MALVVLLTVVVASPAGAAPVDEKRAQAARLERQLEEKGRQVSVLAERYNQARLELSRAEEAMGRVQADLARSEERMQLAGQRMARSAVLAYVQGGNVSLLSQLSRTPGPAQGQMVVRRQYLRLSTSEQQRVHGELRAARQDLAGHRARLDSRRRSARTATQAADSARRQAASAMAGERQLLAGVRGEVARLVADQQARREAESLARRPPFIPAPKLGTLVPPLGNLPIGTGKGAIAVAEARRHLGKPYVYGGSGPGVFDCSGLTSFAWRSAGVRLSHSALTQYRETTRVPMDQIQPGDLLFFGPNVSGIHHNAIYIGSGQMIEASRTGTPVRIRGWRSADLVGIGRPG